MLIIGLTGGIGSGKSEVSRILESLGALIIDADLIGHESYLPYSEAWHELVSAFGNRILGTKDQIDRKQLSAIVFADSEAMSKLNSIVHPVILEDIKKRIADHKREGIATIVIEAALLIEVGWDQLLDEVWIIRSTKEETLQRLGKRDGLSREDVLRRMDRQLPSVESSIRKTIFIDNSSTIAALKQKVGELWNTRVEKGSHQNG